MGDYRKLRAWQAAHRLTLEVYQVTDGYPRREMYGLTAQTRESASSIPANLAEGCGRGSDAELARFSRISLGSANELEYHLLLARDLKILGEEQHARLDRATGTVKRMLARLIRSLTADR